MIHDITEAEAEPVVLLEVMYHRLAVWFLPKSIQIEFRTFYNSFMGQETSKTEMDEKTISFSFLFLSKNQFSLTNTDKI